MLRDELSKVTGIIERYERMIQEQGEQLVHLTLERDRAVLEMDTVGAENEEIRARLAKYVYTIKAYHTPPSRKTITQNINAQKEWKKKNPTGRRKGVSANRKAGYTIPVRGANLKTVKMLPMIWIDVPPKTTTHNRDVQVHILRQNN